eukprot:6174693-Pleurochrysis_carterae.AAC.3
MANSKQCTINCTKDKSARHTGSKRVSGRQPLPARRKHLGVLVPVTARLLDARALLRKAQAQAQRTAAQSVRALARPPGCRFRCVR